MTALLRRGWPVALLLLGACSHVSRNERLQAGDYAESARSTEVGCTTDCAVASPLLNLGDAAFAESTPTAPRHKVVLLDGGQDALLARVHLIRAARRSIDLQTFHFEKDDAGRVVLDELRAAALRGVKVRLLMDQLNGLADPELQARLAGFHRNFELRLYNPVFDQAKMNPLEFAGAVVFRFRSLNQRMHNKMMLVDDRVAVIGGRNVQDEYFDWNDQYNYRDRDLMIAGPVTLSMKRNFDAFWNDRRALPPSQLGDVARVLIQNKGPPESSAKPRSARVERMIADAGDGGAVYGRLSPYLYAVGPIDFFGDVPGKHDDGPKSRVDASEALLGALSATRNQLLLQTPYLVMSRQARQLFRRLHKREAPPTVIVSTNSLAATDAFPVYAMSHKYKRLYLRELGFQIYEYKPFPADMPIDLAAVPGAVEALAAAPPIEEHWAGSGSSHRPVPLKRAGVRIGLHSKSMVVDERIGIVGSHNFDPRSNDYNTESLVMVHDEAFAKALADSIRRDIEPGNSWTIAPKEKLPVLSQLNYNLGKFSEKLPIFDVWPLPYATSYELKPGCQPIAPGAPGFYQCYEAVGDFPEVNLTLKSVYTRVLTVFGAGFIPIL
ncbi:MAG: phospholipase D family protein [Frankiaceae bacterium]|nr:phospholipase D family protein [Arenimonas sp.]